MTRAGLKVRRADAPTAQDAQVSAAAGRRISPDLLALARDPEAGTRKVRVILQDDGAALPAALRREAAGCGVSIDW